MGAVADDRTIGVCLDDVPASRKRLARVTDPARRAEIVADAGEDGYAATLADAEKQLADALAREQASAS